MEEDAKQAQSGVVTMFERLKVIYLSFNISIHLYIYLYLHIYNLLYISYHIIN